MPPARRHRPRSLARFTLSQVLSFCDRLCADGAVCNIFMDEHGRPSGGIRMEFSIKKRQSRSRRGLSFVEFVGCLVAMIGGVLLGFLYLGIDVQKVAAGVLEQAQVVAPGYFSQVAAAPIGEIPADYPTAANGPVLSEGEESGAIIADVETTPAEPAAAAATESEPTADGSKPFAKPEPTTQEKQAATRTYWDQLTGIMLAEAQGRLRGEGNPDEWELYDYLSQRKRGHEDALAKLEKLEHLGVDDRLLEHGDQVIAWHKAGIKLFEHGLSLLSDGPGAKLTGPFAQSWQSAATQLRMEENLVVERHKAVANYLDREYANAAPFVPAFQQQ